jgi:hypothetical protein
MKVVIQNDRDFVNGILLYSVTLYTDFMMVVLAFRSRFSRNSKMFNSVTFGAFAPNSTEIGKSMWKMWTEITLLPKYIRLFVAQSFMKHKKDSMYFCFCGQFIDRML